MGSERRVGAEELRGEEKTIIRTYCMRKESIFNVKKIRQKDLYSLKNAFLVTYCSGLEVFVFWCIHTVSHISGSFSVSLPQTHGINPIKFISPNR